MSSSDTTGSVSVAGRLVAELTALRDEILRSAASASALHEIQELRASVLSRSGRLAALLKHLGQLAATERPAVGAVANEVRASVEAAITSRVRELEEAALVQRLESERLDMSAPGTPYRSGHLHPLFVVEREIREIFHAFGFEVFEGPEIETEEYNFELLNIPPDHPARDLWDTLYVAAPASVDGAAEGAAARPDPDGTILRTHTSPVQIRSMRALHPPIRVLMPGRCFRHEAINASNGSEFFQVEGLVVDRETSLADLKGILGEFARVMFGDGTRTRFRPGYYPFTEPSVAFDIGCLVCGGVGCPACKRTGWMTILGAGMVHPVVLRNGGFDPNDYQGYAFGMGIDRIAMLRYGITDIRLFLQGDLRFLEQFSGGR